MATAAEEIEQPEAVVEEAPQLSEVEQIASEKGWKPKDAFAGNEADWKPAGDFLRGLRTNQDQRRELADLKRSIEGITRAADRQVRREIAERTREIQQQFETAVEAKDTAGAAKAAQAMRDLERDAQPSGEDAEARFQRENPWYGEDEDATAMAIAKAQMVAKRGGSVDDQLKAARDAVHKAFPKLAGAETEEKPQPRAPALHTPTRSTTRAPDKSFASMPAAAQAAATRMYEAAKLRNPDKVPDRKTWDTNYAKDYFADA